MSMTSDLCTEEEIAALVNGFYGRVRKDALLSPVFAEHVKDWDAHLPKMVDFWSSALRKTARYRGTPMPKHAALPGLGPPLFERWLQLFEATTSAQPNEALRQRANELARRIAESLWHGYQLYNGAVEQPRELNAI